MKRLLRGAQVFLEGRFLKRDVAFADRIERIDASIDPRGFDEVFSFDDCFLVPGFLDAHVHLREPGFCYKGTIATETEAAARGGYTTICAMPNLSPVPDTRTHLQAELDAIARSARVRVLPYGALTVGEKGEALSDLEGMAPYVIGYSDDGRGVQSEEIMRQAMTRVARMNGLIAAHCEDDALVRAGQSAQAEYEQIARDIRLVAETGCRYHVCHVSTAQGAALVREAKKRRLPVTCETAPHYVCLNEADVLDDGRFRMNPPIRTRADQAALIAGLLDGAVDMIATDHAPHAACEKDKGFQKSLNGIVGLECAFSVLYTELVETGMMPLSRLVDLMSVRPARVLGLDYGIRAGARADLTVIDPNASAVIDPDRFASMGRATPFMGRRVRGMIQMTICAGEIVWWN